MQFRGLEGPACLSGRCQLGGQVDGADRAEGSTAPHGSVNYEALPPIDIDTSSWLYPAAICDTSGLGSVPVAAALLWTLYPCGSPPTSPGHSEL